MVEASFLGSILVVLCHPLGGTIDDNWGYYVPNFVYPKGAPLCTQWVALWVLLAVLTGYMLGGNLPPSK